MSQQQKSQADLAKGNEPVYSLPGAELDGERTAKWVNLKGTGLAWSSWPAAVLAVDEKLTDLLSHRYVIHYHCELGIVHRAFLCGTTRFLAKQNSYSMLKKTSQIKSVKLKIQHGEEMKQEQS